MAIDQNHSAERLMRLVDETAQRAVVRLVKRLDPAQRVLDIEPLEVDLLAVADDAGNRSETAGDPHRTGVREARQPAREHAGIEFVRARD